RPRHRRGAVDRRLRPVGRRGRGLGGDRRRQPPRPRRPRRARLDGGGIVRGRPPRGALLHPPRRVPRPGGPRGPALRPPSEDPRLARGRGAGAHRARPAGLAQEMTPARTYVALVHHPVLDKGGNVVTTAVTNLDIHDIARAARTYGLAGYFVVTPIAAQRQLVEEIIGHWTRGAGRAHNDKRTDALSLVRVVPS